MQSLSLLAPNKFKELLRRHKTSHDLEPHVRSFCSTYDIDAHRCADELYSFATNFEKFIQSGYETNRDDESSESGDEENDAEREAGAGTEKGVIMTSAMRLYKIEKEAGLDVLW